MHGHNVISFEAVRSSECRCDLSSTKVKLLEWPLSNAL